MQTLTHTLTRTRITFIAITVIFSLTLFSVAPSYARAPMQTAPLVAQFAFTGTPPTIDGNVDGVWSQATTYPLQRVSVNYGPLAAPNPSSISADFKGLYDATNLYLLIEVSDDVRSTDQPTEWWRDDSAEILLDGNLSRGNTYDRVDDRQLAMTFINSNFIAGSGGLPVPTGAKFSRVNTTGNSYRIEAVLPLSSIGITAQAGYRFGFEVGVNDNDDGGGINYRLNWNDSAAGGWVNPSLLGIAELQAPPVPTATPTNTATATTTPTRTPAATPTATSAPTQPPPPTNTATATFTPAPPSPTATAEDTPVPSNTPTPPPTIAPTPQPSQTPETGPGVPRTKTYLPYLSKAQLLGNNHVVCEAYRVVPPVTLSQPADNMYNIYRFNAISTTYAAILENYDTTGSIYVWQIEEDNCAATNTMKLKFMGGVNIVAPNVNYEVTLFGFFEPEKPYVLAVYTNGKLTSQVYKLTLRAVAGR